MTFQQGHYQVPKCWDLSVFLLHQNEKLRIKCPAYLAHGGAEVYSGLSSFRIPANTPLIYEIEVLTCGPIKEVKKFNAEIKKEGAAPVKAAPTKSIRQIL